MSAARMESVSVETGFAQDYARTFDDFVRHMKRQGIPLSDRVMEAAHERATQRATEAARARGFRSVNLAPYAKSGLALARARYGY
jgi:heme-degrading monooxygenase HmoA